MILWAFLFLQHYRLSKPLSISGSVGVLCTVSPAPTFLFSPLTAMQRERTVGMPVALEQLMLPRISSI
jgi:hypothetical protein